MTGCRFQVAGYRWQLTGCGVRGAPGPHWGSGGDAGAEARGEGRDGEEESGLGDEDAEDSAIAEDELAIFGIEGAGGGVEVAFDDRAEDGGGAHVMELDIGAEADGAAGAVALDDEADLAGERLRVLGGPWCLIGGGDGCHARKRRPGKKQALIPPGWERG